MNNPFDLKNYKPQIDMKDVAMAAKSSYQSSFQVNQRRLKGIEPTATHLPGSRQDLPQNFATAMPVMPISKRSEQRRRSKSK